MHSARISWVAVPARLGEKLIQIGAKVVRHDKCVTFQMAELAVPRALFAAILERIRRFVRNWVRLL